jgi:hypothetical protein
MICGHESALSDRPDLGNAANGERSADAQYLGVPLKICAILRHRIKG